jgi:hypothetical protein
VKGKGSETPSIEMHPDFSSPLRSDSVHRGAAHSRPQAEAEEMKKDLETNGQRARRCEERLSLLDGSMAAAGFRESAGIPV